MSYIPPRQPDSRARRPAPMSYRHMVAELVAVVLAVALIMFWFAVIL